MDGGGETNGFSLLAGSSKEEDTLVSEAVHTDSSPEDRMWCSRLVGEGRDPQSDTSFK